MMMGLNVLKEQLEVGRLQSAMGGDRKGLVVTAHRTGVSPTWWAPKGLGSPLFNPCCSKAAWEGSKRMWDVGDTVNRLVLCYP